MDSIQSDLVHTTGATGGVQILIVEDEGIVALDLAATLLQLGYTVAGNVTSGEAAIEQALALKPNLILMDIRLNGPMDGIEAAHAIRGKLEVPIVYLTSHSDDMTLNRAKATSPGGYVVKPFKVAELRCAIEIALHKHETEVALARSEERYRNLVENSPALICTHDMQGRLLSINPAAAQELGYTVAECLGRNIREFLTEKGKNEFDVYLAAIQRNPVVSGNMYVIDRNHRQHIWLFHNRLIHLPTEDSYVLGHAQDITQLVETQNALDRSHRELQRKTQQIDCFYHSVSHELKTPLASASELIAIVAEGEAGTVNPRQREYLGLAKESCLQLAYYINDLLDAARAETNRLDVRLGEVNLKRLVEQNVASMQLRAMAKKIDLHLLSDDGNPIVMADTRRLTQVMLNLLTNAIRYTPDGGEVCVQLVQAPEDPTVALVSIRDSGPGIAPENLERIFERLFQERRTEQTTQGTLGLGLFISRQIIEAHGGAIWAESTPGSGATFTFSLQTAEEKITALDPIRANLIPESHPTQLETH